MISKCFSVIIILFEIISVIVVHSYQINVYYTDPKLARYGGKLNTFTDKEFTQLIHNTLDNIHFIPTSNGKSYFASITTTSNSIASNSNDSDHIILDKSKNSEETKETSYEPIILNPNDFFSLFPSCSINNSNLNNLNNLNMNGHENESNTNINDNELYSYLGMKNDKHYISVELSKHIQDETINNNNKIDVESLLYMYSISKFTTPTKTSSIQISDNKEGTKQISIEHSDNNSYSYSNSNSNNIRTDQQPLVKIISCNLRKIINDYYEDDKDESKQLSTVLALAGKY